MYIQYIFKYNTFNSSIGFCRAQVSFGTVLVSMSELACTVDPKTALSSFLRPTNQNHSESCVMSEL